MARRPQRPMTEARLRNIALHYCQRYLVSEAKLRVYLARRLARSPTAEDERARLAEAVAGIAAEMARLGLADDREAASARLRGALRAGYAEGAAVGVAARAAMVPRETAEGALPAALADTVPELDDALPDESARSAALARLALSRARRGPFRTAGQDEGSRRRDAAWLARRGFRFADIRAALEIDSEEG